MAMLFYLSYSVNKKDNKSILKEYSDNELGTSFALTYLKMSICGVKIDDLLVDCAFQNQIICSGGKSSCDVVNESMSYLLNKTLDKWDKSYGITIRFTQRGDDNYTNNWQTNGPLMTYYDDDKWSYIRYNCTEETTGKRAPGIFLIPIPGTGDSVSLEAGMCK